MKISSLTVADMEAQWQHWTIVGPIPSISYPDEWCVLDQDAARKIPSGDVLALNGFRVQVKRVRLKQDVLDFKAHYGHPEGRPQGYAFTEISVPEEGTLTFTYDADWRTVWWMDGREIANTRMGNGGFVGQMRYPVSVVLNPGRHVITVRVISGSPEWLLITQVTAWQSGVADTLRTDRGAQWRDYKCAVVRLEMRPVPDGKADGIPKEDYAMMLANRGVNACWLGVVHGFHPYGSYYKSKYLPMWRGAKPEHERQLKEWVQLYHRHRMAVITWIPLLHIHEAWESHPEWRQQKLTMTKTGSVIQDCPGQLCINTPYGEAMIGYAIEALKKFDLDGIWFDGAWFSGYGVFSCFCPACRKRFKANTGLDLPRRIDWALPEFRRWVQWRFDMFSDYWQRLVDEVHREVPEVSIAFTHNPVCGTGWLSAIPFMPFGRGFISAVEVSNAGPLFSARFMRAYGRLDSEIWRSLGNTTPKTELGYRYNRTVIRNVVEGAIAAATVGAHSSVGGSTGIEGCPEATMGLIADELTPRTPYLSLPTVPYAALLVSQQNAAFVFGRNPKHPAMSTDVDHSRDYYGQSLIGWHDALAWAGLTCDVVFDSLIGRQMPDARRQRSAVSNQPLTINHRTPPERFAQASQPLFQYPILIMPLAVALTTAQYETIMAYVRGGGTLVTGPWFGLCDQWGEPHHSPLGAAVHFPFGRRLFDWESLDKCPELILTIPDNGRHEIKVRPLHALPKVSKIALTRTGANPILQTTRLGKGRIVQLAVDIGTLVKLAKSDAVTVAMHRLFRRLAIPLVEVENRQAHLVLGVFRKGAAGRTVVVHIQQLAPSWQAAPAGPKPNSCWNTMLRWNGAKPRSIKCALPELSPELPTTRRGNAWEVILPPFTWGQVVMIEE